MRAQVVVWAALISLSGLVPAVDDLPPELAGQLMPQVLTPARLQQAQVDVAASVTVIDHEMITALGARDLPELLRLVPGMMVTKSSGHEFSANYHGTNLRDIRRLQVLVDGMSVYQPSLARILWSDLALSIDDIERIEVTRGPDAAAYGANSFSGVINIITTHPQDSTENMVRVTAGSRGTSDGAARVVAHTPDSDYRLSISRKADTGFDVLRDGMTENRDSRDIRTFNWRSEYRPTDSDRLEVLAGAADTDKEEEAATNDIFVSYQSDPLVEVKNMHLLGRWSRDFSPSHALQVQAYFQETDTKYRWRSCLDQPIFLSSELAALEAINQDYALGLLDAAGSGDMAIIGAYIGALPAEAAALATQVVQRFVFYQTTGFTAICGDANLDFRENRVDLEVQDTLRISDDFRLVSGFSYRRDSGSSESYVGGPAHAELWRLFGHAEYRLARPLVFNLGAMLEGDTISGTQFSPRAGLNWHLAEQQSLRLVGSRAVRNQDICEEYADTSITLRNLSPAWVGFPLGADPDDGATTRMLFLTQQSAGNLQPEKITAWELGYFGYFPRWRAEMDVRWFREELRNLISDPINFFSFQADNDSATNLTGVEWQLRRNFAPGNWLWASYAYIDNDSSHVIERKFTARHSGSVAVAHRFASRWAASAAWYVNRYQNQTPSGAGWRWHHSERIDLRLSKDIPLGESALQLSANAQCDLDANPEIYIDNRNDSRLYGYFGMQLTF